MPPMLGATYDPGLQEYVAWKTRNTTYSFHAVHPVTAEHVEVSTTVFADDVVELLRTPTACDVSFAAQLTSDTFDACVLHPRGLAQNATKTEYSTCLRGVGSNIEMKRLQSIL